MVPTIASRVKIFRERKNMSQRALAKKAGLSPSHIEHVESGYIKSPRFDTLVKIADALGVSRAKFFGREEPS